MSQSTQAALGSVVSLRRCPVKSTLGEELQAAEVTDRGLLGDGAYALPDRSDGKVASANNPRTRPQLFDCRAVFVEAPRSGAPLPPARITLPDGTLLSGQQNDVNQLLSEVLHWEVMLAAADRGQREVVESTLPNPWMPKAGKVPKDPGILRTDAQHNRVNVGVYTSVVRGGTLRRGDAVRLAES